MNEYNNRNGWTEWSKYVLKELEELNKKNTEINKQLLEMHVEVATLKVKSGIWGAIAGLVPAIVTLIYFMLKTWK